MQGWGDIRGGRAPSTSSTLAVHQPVEISALYVGRAEGECRADPVGRGEWSLALAAALGLQAAQGRLLGHRDAQCPVSHGNHEAALTASRSLGCLA